MRVCPALEIRIILSGAGRADFFLSGIPKKVSTKGPAKLLLSERKDLWAEADGVIKECLFYFHPVPRTC